MPEVHFTDTFMEGLARVCSPTVEGRIRNALQNLREFPEYGSARVPDSIRREFGSNVRKVVVNPFDLFYTYYPERNLVVVEALVHQRNVK